MDQTIEAFKKAAKEHTPIGRVTFVVDAETYIYDFDILTFAQRENARAVYHFGHEMENNPPESLSKMFLSGGAEITIRAFGFLLRRVDADGNVEPFSMEHAQGQNLTFIRNLVGEKDADKIMECQNDFFTRASVANLELVRHSKAFAAAQAGIRAQFEVLSRHASTLLNNKPDNEPSGGRANSSAGRSTKGKTRRSFGSSQEKTQSASKKRVK